MSNYAPAVNPVALVASPFQAGNGSVVHGADPVTPSTNPKKYGTLDYVLDVLDSIPGFSSAALEKEAEDRLKTQAKGISQTFIWSVVLVVIGLMLLSRGFGMIGEEGESVIVNLANPSKFPGIGHGIQSLKRGKR